MNRLSFIKEAITTNPITLSNLQALQLTINNGAATIWFNCPSTLNAVSNQMRDQFKFLLPTLDNDTTIKLILIRSKHPKAFCVGADVKDLMQAFNGQDNSHQRIQLGKVFRSVRKPIISVVEGLALGGGFQIALMSDIILCSEKASFGLPQIKLGIIPGLGGTQALPRIVGTKLATRLILTGDSINGIEAHRLNIAHLLPSENFEEKVKSFVDVLLNRASDALQAGKKAVKTSLETTLEQGLQHQTTIFQALFNKKGPREGITAFIQKRKPNFRNI